MSDEDPPDRRAPKTPAEAAGATPLDADKFRAHGGAPMLGRNREIIGEVQLDPEEPRVVRRSRYRAERRRNGLTAVLTALAVILIAGGLAMVVGGWLTEPTVQATPSAPPEAMAVTPVLSARRAADALVAPIASKNLSAAVAPVLAAAPPDSCVAIADGTTTLDTLNPGSPLIPASNTKVVTAAAALALLDPAERFSTKFVTDGTPTDGTTIEGNLYMIGGGDPLLSTSPYLAQLPNGRQPSTDMAAVADQIVATGVRRITGSVVGDESRYDTVRTPASWPQRYLTQGQAGPLSALIVDDGWVIGSGPTSDPAQHAASVLTGLLNARGVQVDGAATSGTAPANAPVLTEVPSATVEEMVAEMLAFSDNTTAELLTKEIGLRASGKGTTPAGVAAVAEWLSSSGLAAEGVSLDDGSGLSENNRLTCQLLIALHTGAGADSAMANGLAHNGAPGTLHDRFTAAAFKDRIRAKTGTLRPATSLSGWVRTNPDRNLAFAIVVNRPGGQVTAGDTALQGRLLEAMLGYPDAPSADSIAPAAPTAPA